jgi:hypothetical protein
MKRLPILIFLAAALLAVPAHARQVSGVEMPETMESTGVSLLLNGAGVRTRFFVDVYVGGLYLKQRSADAAAIIAADEPMAIKLLMISGLVTRDRMKKSIEEGFQRSTRGNTAPIRQKIDALIAVYDEEIAADDVFDIVYVPDTGLEVYKNGARTATIRSGLPFKRALFGIWISDRPIQESLKRGMLGQ